MRKSGGSKAILFAALVIVMLGFGIAIPLLPFYITHFNASASALGLMMSLYSFMQFLFAPLWGRWSDRHGRKPALLIGIAGFFFSFILQGLSQNVVQLILSRSLAGILSSATLPSALAYIADTTSEEDRSKGAGLMGAALGMGMIFGPLLGGLLTHVSLDLPQGIARLLQSTVDSAGQTISLSIPFFASALLALAALPFIFFLLPESHPLEMRSAHSQAASGSRARLLLGGLRGPNSVLFLLSFLLAFALANIESILGIYGQQRFAMNPSDVGILMGGMGLLSVIQQGLLIGPLTRKFGEVRIVQGGLLISILGFVGLALSANRPLLYTAALVFSFGNVLLQPSVTALISRRTKGGQGAAMGLNNSFQSLGRAAGPLWAGFAYDVRSTLSFWTGAVIQAAALAICLRTLDPGREPAPGAQEPAL